MSDGLVIIGGSYAGLQIATSARDFGYQESIRIVSDEAFLPYHRPPLSKGWLTGKVSIDNLPIRGESFYRTHAIDVILSSRVESIDRATRTILLASGDRLGYDRLAFATGARPRPLRLPGGELDGVVVLRSLADAQALAEGAQGAQQVVVIGAGFIGLEVAASLVSLGKQVTVIEAQDRVLARAVSPTLSTLLGDLHVGYGVRLITHGQVSAIEGDGKRVRSVLCGDGERLPADLVLVGIGALPNSELAEASGLACGNGIVVDALAATQDPLIVAAGDCALHPNPHAKDMIRLESVQNATDQAKTAAATLVGRVQPYKAVPWFWSDQYDVKLQMVGLSQGADRVVLRGIPENRKFSLYHFRNGAIIAVDSINAPADHMVGRKLIAAKAGLSPEQAADLGFDLKSLLAI